MVQLSSEGRIYKGQNRRISGGCWISKSTAACDRGKRYVSFVRFVIDRWCFGNQDLGGVLPPLRAWVQRGTVSEELQQLQLCDASSAILVEIRAGYVNAFGIMGY